MIMLLGELTYRPSRADNLDTDISGLSPYVWFDQRSVDFTGSPNISTWDNRQGTAGRDMRQATAAEQPEIQTNKINNVERSVFFDKTTKENLEAANTGHYNFLHQMTTDYTLFFVVRTNFDTGSVKAFVCSSSANGSGEDGFWIRQNSGTLYAGFLNRGAGIGTVQASTTIVKDRYSIIMVRYYDNAGTYTLELERDVIHTGSDTATGTPDTTTPSHRVLVLGASQGYSNTKPHNPWDGWIPAWCMFQSKLSDADIDTVLNFYDRQFDLYLPKR